MPRFSGIHGGGGGAGHSASNPPPFGAGRRGSTWSDGIAKPRVGGGLGLLSLMRTVRAQGRES